MRRNNKAILPQQLNSYAHLAVSEDIQLTNVWWLFN